jgi:hypothetical protein
MKVLQFQRKRKPEPPIPKDTTAWDYDVRQWFARILRDLKYMKNKMPNDSVD